LCKGNTNSERQLTPLSIKTSKLSFVFEHSDIFAVLSKTRDVYLTVILS
jgi:hypothetical protein